MTRLAITLVILGAILVGSGSPGPGAVRLSKGLTTTGLGNLGAEDQVATGINLATNGGDTPATVIGVELIGPLENPPPAEVWIVCMIGCGRPVSQVGGSDWPMTDGPPGLPGTLHEVEGYEMVPGVEVEFRFVFNQGGSPRWEGMRLRYMQNGHEYSDRTNNVIVLCPGSTEEVRDCMDRAAA